MNLSLIRSIYKTDAFFEGQAEKRDSGERALNQTEQTLFIDGKEIPLYDLSLLLSEGSAVSDSDGKRIMLTDIQGHFIAVKADRIENVISVAGDRIEPLPPVFGNPSLICFPRVLKQADTLILLLDIEGIEKSKISQASKISKISQASKISKTSQASKISKTSEVSGDELNLISSAILKSIKELAEDIKPEELETLLTRIVQEKIIADIIIRHLKKIIERSVFLEIKRIKKVLPGAEK